MMETWFATDVPLIIFGVLALAVVIYIAWRLFAWCHHD
jgi:hypothetical protein